MSPGLCHGDYVLTHKLWRKLSVGDVVVVQHPELGVIVKRILKVQDDEILLTGDNVHASASPERMGQVNYKHVLGRVCAEIHA